MEGFCERYSSVKRELAYGFTNQTVNPSYFNDFDYKALSAPARWYLIALTFSWMPAYDRKYLRSLKFERDHERLYRFAKVKNIPYSYAAMEMLKKEMKEHEKNIVNKINLTTNRLEAGEQLTIGV